MSSELQDSANRALGSIICQMKKCGGFPLSTFQMLIESCVYSIIDYGMEIYGFNPHPSANSVQLRALRSFLGVKKTTPTAGIKAEMRMLEPRSRAQIRIVSFFLRICD